jgi:hypothetical protein
MEMKKVWSFLMVMAVLTTALWVNIGTAGATPAQPPHHFYNPGPPTVVVYSPYFKDLRPGKRLQAQIFVESSFQNIQCVVTDRVGHVACKDPRRYAGLFVVLHLQAAGQNLAFYLKLPDVRVLPITPA